MSRKLKIKSFDPNSVGNINNGIFGLPFTLDEAQIVLLPIPWDVTVSYAAGASKGPKAIFNASFQVDLFDPYFKDAWKLGVAMAPINTKLKKQSKTLRVNVENYIETLSNGADEKSEENIQFQSIINEACSNMVNWVEQETTNYLNAGKLVVGLGGDHSTPLGIFKAMAKKHGDFGILQIDAHADLRNAYEGFEFSHASIMYNALKIKEVKTLTQVGIRDYCEEENTIITNSKGRVKTFFDKDIKHAQYSGKSIKKIHEEIVKTLPNKVFISFDIDGLDPKLCPNTGTPVSGGFETEEVLHLLEMVVAAGKTIIGFDLNEVAPGNDEYDASVAARILYRMLNILAKSNGLKV
jgi:agmatinase